MNALVIHEGKNITEKKIPNLLYEKFGWTNLFYFNNLKKQTGLISVRPILHRIRKLH